MRVLFIFTMTFISLTTMAQKQKLTTEMVLKLAEMPLHCISQEYPNKTGHTFNNADEVPLTPSQLHPVFYGCFDWHSSVHGHWMLVRLLNKYPNIPAKKKIITILENSFQLDKIQVEADYFTKYALGKNFERTYGWAWLLKLDEELMKSPLQEAQKWHKNLQPLTDTIVKLWKAYLPKMTYPNRTGVHPNSAFALGFTIDWAKEKGDSKFEQALKNKAIAFYGTDKDTPAYLEPDGSDFFSPSLEIAYLMSRIYDTEQFEHWFAMFLNERGLQNVSEIPIVSDLNDYQTVHLVGLSFSRAWCMKGIASHLSDENPRKQRLLETSNKLIDNGIPLLFQGNYGGGHWLASFAVYAYTSKEIE